MTEPARPAPAGIGPDRGALVLGAILVVGGVALLVGQLFDIRISELRWPMIIVAVGVVLLALGLFADPDEGKVVGGTVVTTVGLVLLYQSQTGLWSTWAYAWALVGPAASGLGEMIWAARTSDPKRMRRGTWAFLGGLAMFAIGFLFFEGVIGLNGDRLPIADWVLPVVVIGIGVIVLGRGLLSRE